MHSHDDPNCFIPLANRLFREEPDLTAGPLVDFVPAPPDRSRSPRNLSDEARLLQRLAEPELPPAPTDIEISNQRAAELAAAREQIARLTASISVMRTHITRLEAGITAVHDELYDGLHETSAAMNDPARDSSALRVAHNRMVDAHNGLARLQPATAQQLRRADGAEPQPARCSHGRRVHLASRGVLLLQRLLHARARLFELHK